MHDRFAAGCRRVVVDAEPRVARLAAAPPRTTDFAILFLPTEGLYAEVIRRTGLVEVVQRECRVLVAGPTTLAALLNSLQMGFRTLAIQQRSSEVWAVLGAVKTEFGKFGGVIERVRKKLQEASNAVDEAATRSRVMERKLRDVEEMPRQDAPRLLGTSADAYAEHDALRLAGSFMDPATANVIATPSTIFAPGV